MRRHVWDVEALGLTPRYPTHCEGAWALFDIQTSRLLLPLLTAQALVVQSGYLAFLLLVVVTATFLIESRN